MPKPGGGGIVVPILISLLATVGIAAGGFGIGTGIGRVMYGPIVEPVQDSGQNSSRGSETQMDNNRAHTMGSSLGPNVYEKNGVIVWQSEYWGSHGDGSNVTGGEPASTPVTPVTPEPDQAQDTVDDPGQITTAKPVQDQAVQPAQTQAPAQSSTSNTGSGGRGNADNFNAYDNSEQQKTTDKWVINASTKKIHYPSCDEVKKIAPQNYSTSNLTESELINQGYSTCKRCH